MWRQVIVGLIAVAFISSDSSAREVDPKPKPVIQIALLLDTSNSMDGLIHQAQTQLWTIVNEMARCRRDGREPRVVVALYEYGNSRLAVTDGYIRQVLPFTDDLDRVSEQLFKLKTSGGDEYCGEVIQRATRDLEWITTPGTFRAIFIAGNEPFSQGSVDYHNACRQAIGRGIVVNTIHCGIESDGVAGGWREGAQLAEGRAMNIDQDRTRVAIKCPQDETIIKLSVELNSTYVPYGRKAKESETRQRDQDHFAALAPESGAGVQRGVAKANSAYQNASWDLVDAVKDGKCDVAKLEDMELPETMKQMTPGERTEYVKKQSTRRAELQGKINELNAEREKIVAAQQPTSDVQTFDSAIVGAVREQLQKNEFVVPSQGK